MKEPHTFTMAHDPVRRERPQGNPFPGSAAWWRANYKARGVPKPDWWERTTCLPWDEEKADE